MTRPTRQQLLREKALGYLAQREHAYQELKRKLEAYAARLASKDASQRADDEFEQSQPAADGEQFALENAQWIDELLQDFKQRGWLSEQRFTEQVVHARKSKFGSMRIAHELREKGIAEELVEKAVHEVKLEEYANALAIWRKKYAAAPASREEWAKQARFMQSRGFNFDVIKRVLNSTPEHEI